jgi:hypothetical protein
VTGQQRGREIFRNPPTLFSTSSPKLKSLHAEGALSNPKLAELDRLSTELLIGSLALSERSSLKVRADGTILDGHHRIVILRRRGVDVDRLPREIVIPTNFEN